MKNITTRLFSILISICLIFAVCLSQSITVHAVMKSYTWDELKKNAEYFLTWAYSQMGAVFQDHDFYKFIQNEDAWDSYFNENHVSINDDSITIDKEFTSWLKQYLINYSKKYQTYYYVWSTDFDDIPYGEFGSQKNVYDTVKNVLATAPSKTIKVFLTSGMEQGVYTTYLYIGAFENLRDVGFVHHSKYNQITGLHYSYSTWENIFTDIYCVKLTPSDVITSWESFKESAIYVNKSKDGSDMHSDNLKTVMFCNETSRYYPLTVSMPAIVTPTRTTFRMFKDTDFMFDYSLDKRGIYFTSDFWEYEPGDITGTLEDLNDSIGRMQDLIDMLLDRIGDNSSESEIEELLRQILEELKNGNGSGDTGGSSGGSDSSKDYSEFFKDILGYLKTMNSNIKDILDNLKSFKNYVIAKDIADIISDLFDDPETGSKDMVNGLYSSFGEFAGILTDKFPFCIPFDLYRLFGILAGLGETEAVTLDSYDSGPLHSIASSMNEYGIDASNILVYADGGGHNRDPGSGESGNTYAPYFELPIVIERYGIDERIIVDMKPFQPISTLSRFLFTIVFCVGLIKFTIKFADILKGMFE